jgi:hypothetical protein
VQLDLPETEVCSATAGYKAMLDDAAARYGLSPDIPGRLVSAGLRHMATEGTVAGATRAAAAELGIAEDIAMQLAALAGDQFDAAAPQTAAA